MDVELVKRAQKGDERAFEALVVAGHPESFRVAYGILRDSNLAEDAVQHAFLEIWRSLSRLSDQAQYEAWAARHLVEACRRTDAQPNEQAGATAVEPAGPVGADPFGTVIDRDQLSRGFRLLSFDDRAVLVLRYLSDMDAEAMAFALGLKGKAVEQRTEAALASLEAALDDDGVPGSELAAQMESA
ncbi:MAG: sigma factor [Chloroflexota bacterium]|jgi:RNA polymerase sigma-70 factor (ECF subfamily)